jgi:hypothetical protein
MASARNTVLNQLKFGMLIVVMSAAKLPGEVKQNNPPPKCRQPIVAGGSSIRSSLVRLEFWYIIEK